MFARPLHSGRINPMLFGNFIELLDDLVPGMWGEMLNDRGFEGVTPPAKWVYYDGAPTLCDRRWDKGDRWAVETKGVFNGPRCVRITGLGDRVASLTQSGLAVKNAKAYRFSAYLRREGDLRAQVVLKMAVPDGRFVELASADLPAPAATWKKCTGPTRNEGDQRSGRVRVANERKGNALGGQALADAGRQPRGLGKDVVEAIRAAHPALIRWGGSTVDPGRYRWKQGIGDRDLRVPFANTNWGRIDSNDVGIDEFCQFCELVAAQPLICVSFSDGPASAADLVQYCNGAADSQWGARRGGKRSSGALPCEILAAWQRDQRGRRGVYQKCREFIRAMKRADPGIAVVSSFPSQKVLDVLGRQLAYLAPHHYTRNLAACEADFAKLSRMIARTPGCNHLRIAVTEWNFTAGDWGLLRGKMLTLEGALLNAHYLNLLCRHSDIVEIACRSNMTNSFCSGIIGTRPAGLLKRPSYHVMKLYADHALPIPLSVGALPDRD